jgi:hypothetical protein
VLISVESHHLHEGLTPVKVGHYLYNAFIFESGKIKIAIDPGFNLWIWRPGNLIPKGEWPGDTHILVTHGDIDHNWSPDRMAEVSEAHLICGKDLARQNGNETYVLDPRSNKSNRYPRAGRTRGHWLNWIQGHRQRENHRYYGDEIIV